MGDPFVANIMAAVRAMRRAEFVGSPQLGLGQLIDALAALDPALPVSYDGGGVPTEPDSYRGYYDELALGIANRAEPPTAGEVLGWLRAADGATFTGYKGGDFVMGRETPVWVSNHGRADDVMVVGVDGADGAVVIRTAETDD